MLDSIMSSEYDWVDKAVSLHTKGAVHVKCFSRTPSVHALYWIIVILRPFYTHTRMGLKNIKLILN